jgi:carbonic anhydrase/acetyltransferase-like protein (isoleucine patch superfamily)
MLYSFENKTPELRGDNIFISEQACVIGSVIIENNVCILPQVVIRADNDTIHIGEGTNIQDGAVIHTDPGIPIKIGKDVTIAHQAMLHGCNVGNGSVIGIGAVALNNTVIGKNCMVGANALVLENAIIPDGALVMGSPAKVKKQLTEEEIENMKLFARHYVEKISRFKKNLTLLAKS